MRQAGLEICSGGIVGMGEEAADVVELALRLGELQAEAVPVNFLLPIPGIRLAEKGDKKRGQSHFATERPSGCFAQNAPVPFFAPAQPPLLPQGAGLVPAGQPPWRVAMAAGREMHLGPLATAGLYAANSIFVDGYLTADGQPPEDDSA